MGCLNDSITAYTQATLQVNTCGKHCWSFLPPDFKIYLVLSLMPIWRVFTFLCLSAMIHHNGRYITISISAGNIPFRTSHDKLGQLHCAFQTVASFWNLLFWQRKYKSLFDFQNKSLFEEAIYEFVGVENSVTLVSLFLEPTRSEYVPKQLSSWGKAASIYQWWQETLELQQVFSSPRTLEDMDSWNHVWKAWIASVTFICMEYQGLRFCNWTNGNGIHLIPFEQEEELFSI